MIASGGFGGHFVVWANERGNVEQSVTTGNEGRLECAVVLINAIAEVIVVVIEIWNKERVVRCELN